MSFLVLITDNESIEKSRKALFTASVLLLFFSSLEFLSEEFNFFGLRVAVSHERLILLGQLCVGFILLRFISLLLVQFFEWTHSRMAKNDKSWEDEAVASYNAPDNSDEYFVDPDPWEENFDFVRKLREKRRGRVATTKELLEHGFGVFYNAGLPILLGLVCLIWPESLSHLLNSFIDQNIK